jgi:hypothetical protein
MVYVSAALMVIAVAVGGWASLESSDWLPLVI